MKTTRPTRSIVLLAAALLTGCAALLSHPEPPRVTVADLHLVGVTLLEQRYRLSLRVQNPNSFELPIEGIDYELRVNDQPFGSGVSNKPVTVPAYGTEMVDVEAFSTLAGLLRQLRDLDKGIPSGLRYHLKGHVRLSRSGLKLPFDQSGEISLGTGRTPGEGVPL